jgi:hypothetical protein
LGDPGPGDATGNGKTTAGTFDKGKVAVALSYTLGSGQNCETVPVTSATVAGTYTITWHPQVGPGSPGSIRWCYSRRGAIGSPWSLFFVLGPTPTVDYPTVVVVGGVVIVAPGGSSNCDAGGDAE